VPTCSDSPCPPTPHVHEGRLGYTGVTSPADHIRAWAVRTLQWDPLRNTVKYGVHGFARARGRVIDRAGRVPPIANIYTASSPKAGSQFMKALFDHPVVRSHTGLLTLPQLDYQQDPERGFP